MSNLHLEHPEIHEAFLDGDVSIQISGENPFGHIPMDQTTEVTVNKDTQTPQGTRFSLKSGAVKSYYITAEHRSAFLGQLKDMVQGGKSDYHHAELQRSWVQKDEEAVSAVTSLLESWVDPFAENQDLISISTASKVPQEIASDLKNAFEIGEKCYVTFKEERLETDPPKKRFHDQMKMNKLKTFSIYE